MKVDKSLVDDYAVLTLKGEFDTFYCPRFQEEVESLLAQGINHVIVNMRLVKFVNSTALGAIIKAYKRCKAEGGELVVARPSSFVSKVVRSLGIDQLVPLFDDEDAATKHIVQSLNQLELAGDAPVEEEKVLVTFPDETRHKQLGGRKTCVGTMCNVDGQRVQFSWSPDRLGLSTDQAKQIFYPDSKIHLKFQVKLFKKGYFELDATVIEADTEDDKSIKVTAEFESITPSDGEALGQFAADMEFLKRQLPGGK
ncbi:MAG: STAS domain-containing protein [Planctomycetota bacterium]